MLRYIYNTRIFVGILEVRLYPYGNAKEIPLPDGSYAYKCQHGEEECKGNFIEACILDATNYNPEYFLPVIDCMESADDTINAAPECLELFIPNLPYKIIDECAKVGTFSKRGKKKRKSNIAFNFRVLKV